MAHVIPKKIYSKFRLRKKNIEVLCYQCHTTYDHETDKAKKDPMFDWLFKKKKQLARQYNRMSKANLFFLLDM